MYIITIIYICTLWQAYLVFFSEWQWTHSAGRGATSVCGLSTTPAIFVESKCCEWWPSHFKQMGKWGK